MSAATMSAASWAVRLRTISPAAVLLVVVGAGFVVRPSPVWAMLFYLTVLPVCGLRLLHREGWPNDAGSVTGIALLVWFTLGTAWDAAAGTHFDAHALWIWNGLCTLVFVAASRAAFGAPGPARERLVTVLIVGALLNTAIVLARTAFLGIEDGRLGGWAETRHPILGASMIGTCLVLAAGRLLAGRTVKLATVTLLAGLLFIVLTGSRGPLIAIVASLGFLLAMVRPRLLLALVAGAALLFALLALLEPTMLRHAWSRLLERGWSSRLDIWQLALHEIAERPWFGYGPSARLDRAIDNFPHNLFLSTLFYSGAVGLALLLALFGLATRGALRQPDLVARATCLALLAHLVLSGLTDLSQVIKGPGPLWYIIWIPFILALGPASPAETIENKPSTGRRVHLAERSRA